MAVRRRRSSKLGAKRPVGWIRTFASAVPVDDTPTVDFLLIEGADWAIGTMNEMGTVRRIRVELSVSPTPLSAPESSLFWAVYVSDRDAALQSPAAVGILDENMLGMGCITFGLVAAAAVERSVSHQLSIDIKAMRKVREDEQVHLVFRMNTALAGVSISGYTSLLFSRGQS